MDVSTITMDPAQAREKLRHYRRAVHRRADAEYERAAKAYESLAEGKPLIALSEVIAAAPRDAKGRPRLAIARADRRQVVYRSRFTGEQFEVVYSRKAPRDALIEVPRSPATPAAWTTGYALVPMVPPEVRLTRDLSQFFTLWEVEAWSDTLLGVDADRDPYLLQRIDVDLYAVVGEWDLTEVERAITRGRRQG